jgi:hypothetical protein
MDANGDRNPISGVANRELALIRCLHELRGYVVELVQPDKS